MPMSTSEETTRKRKRTPSVSQSRATSVQIQMLPRATSTAPTSRSVSLQPMPNGTSAGPIQLKKRLAALRRVPASPPHKKNLRKSTIPEEDDEDEAEGSEEENEEDGEEYSENNGEEDGEEYSENNGEEDGEEYGESDSEEDGKNDSEEDGENVIEADMSHLGRHAPNLPLDREFTTPTKSLSSDLAHADYDDTDFVLSSGLGDVSPDVDESDGNLTTITPHLSTSTPNETQSDSSPSRRFRWDPRHSITNQEMVFKFSLAPLPFPTAPAISFLDSLETSSKMMEGQRNLLKISIDSLRKNLDDTTADLEHLSDNLTRTSRQAEESLSSSAKAKKDIEDNKEFLHFAGLKTTNEKLRSGLRMMAEEIERLQRVCEQASVEAKQKQEQYKLLKDQQQKAKEKEESYKDQLANATREQDRVSLALQVAQEMWSSNTVALQVLDAVSKGKSKNEVFAIPTLAILRNSQSPTSRLTTEQADETHESQHEEASALNIGGADNGSTVNSTNGHDGSIDASITSGVMPQMSLAAHDTPSGGKGNPWASEPVRPRTYG